MNKRLKKKANSYRKLTYKQRIKNQGKTIRQLYSEIEMLKNERKLLENSYCLAYEVVGRLEVKCEAMQDVISHQKEEVERLQSPWWKRGIRCK